MRGYVVDFEKETIEGVDLTPPYSVQEDGTVDVESESRPVYQQFSSAKARLVEHLGDLKSKVQDKIYKARKLTRSDIAQEPEVAQGTAD